MTMMTSVPAVVAGVPELAIFTPPAPDGSVDAATLVAARIAGVETVYKCGGSQAIAAAAYGTETVKPALRSSGRAARGSSPPNGCLPMSIDAGLPAGPSEAIIFADDTRGWRARRARPPDRSRARTGFLRLSRHAQPQGRRGGARRAAGPLGGDDATQRVDFSRTVLTGTRGGIVLTPRSRRATASSTTTRRSIWRSFPTSRSRHLGHITEAAEILMGPHTPVTIANFVLGPNAVLPTSRWARTFGPLSVTDFVKRSSIGYVTSAAYPAASRGAQSSCPNTRVFRRTRTPCRRSATSCLRSEPPPYSLQLKRLLSRRGRGQRSLPDTVRHRRSW